MRKRNTSRKWIIRTAFLAFSALLFLFIPNERAQAQGCTYDYWEWQECRSGCQGTGWRDCTQLFRHECCDAQGRYWNGWYCTMCKGTGQVAVPHTDQYQTCSSCSGEGWIVCSYCAGRGMNGCQGCGGFEGKGGEGGHCVHRKYELPNCPEVEYVACPRR